MSIYSKCTAIAAGSLLLEAQDGCDEGYRILHLLRVTQHLPSSQHVCSDSKLRLGCTALFGRNSSSHIVSLRNSPSLSFRPCPAEVHVMNWGPGAVSGLPCSSPTSTTPLVPQVAARRPASHMQSIITCVQRFAQWTASMEEFTFKDRKTSLDGRKLYGSQMVSLQSGFFLRVFEKVPLQSSQVTWPFQRPKHDLAVIALDALSSRTTSQPLG